MPSCEGDEPWVLLLVEEFVVWKWRDVFMFGFSQAVIETRSVSDYALSRVPHLATCVTSHRASDILN